MTARKPLLNPEFRLLAKMLVLFALLGGFALWLHLQDTVFTDRLLSLSACTGLAAVLLIANLRNKRRDDGPREFELLVTHGMLISMPAPALAGVFLRDARSLFAVGFETLSYPMAATALAVLLLGTLCIALLLAVLGTYVYTLVRNGIIRRKVLASAGLGDPKGAELLAPTTRTLYDHDWHIATKLD